MMYDADKHDAPEAIARAKEVCAICPVIAECRDWVGLAREALVGQNVTAGMNADEQRLYRSTRLADRAAIKAAAIPPCGTAKAMIRHRELGESCYYCNDIESRRRVKPMVDAGG